MTVTAISITRALATVKSLNKEIEERNTGVRNYIGVVMGEAGENTSVQGLDKEGLKAKIQADTDKYESLIRQVFEIKSKINESNAKTVVTVNNKEMTVSDAILAKSQIGFKKKQLQVYQTHHKNIQGLLEKLKKQFDERVESIIATSIPTTASDIEIAQIRYRITEEQTKITGPNLFDPMGIVKKIDDLEKEIKFLELELDYVLSTSNTVTMIEVDLT